VTSDTDLRVSVLSMTPVKGLALHRPLHLNVSAGGVEGDRSFFLVKDDGGVISCTDLGSLMRHRAEYDPSTRVMHVHGPDGLLRSDVVELGEPLVTDFFGLRDVTGHVALGWDGLFSEIAGRSVRLVLGDSGGYDVAGLTLLGTPSTDALAARNQADPVDGRRFRMNVEISTTAPHDEDTWEGRELRLGEVVVRVGGPVKRCAATTRNPDTGEVDLQTLRMIGASRGRQQTAEWGKGFYFGVYAEVLAPGRIHVGDPVSLV
jgi:uncharacterized protein YcbX